MSDFIGQCVKVNMVISVYVHCVKQPETGHKCNSLQTRVYFENGFLSYLYISSSLPQSKLSGTKK